MPTLDSNFILVQEAFLNVGLPLFDNCFNLYIQICIYEYLAKKNVDAK